VGCAGGNFFLQKAVSGDGAGAGLAGDFKNVANGRKRLAVPILQQNFKHYRQLPRDELTTSPGLRTLGQARAFRRRAFRGWFQIMAKSEKP